MNQPLGQIDPNVRLPAAVIAQRARADELIKNQNATSQGNNPDPAAAPELTVAASEPTITASEPQVAPATPPAPAPAPVHDAAYWENMYKTTSGRLARSQDQLNDMREQIQNLQGVIAGMQAAPAPKPPAQPTEKLLTPAEEEEYGKDLLSVVGKKAREELAPIFNAYETKIANLESQVQATQAATSVNQQQKLLDNLDAKMPEWREINTDQKFLDWLALPDAYSGAMRMDMLKAAYAQGNASRVLAFFNGFLAQEAAVAPQVPPDTTGTVRVPKVPLADLAAPGRAKTAATITTPAEKPSFTRADIAQFYADVNANVYRGRDAEKNAKEAQIFEAQRDGRIR